MSKSNYKILEENKAESLKFATKIAEKPTPQVESIDKLQAAKEALNSGDFPKAIILLDEIKDNKLGIIWTESKDLGNGTRTRVRDARNVTIDPKVLKQEQGEKYAMQILNEIQAGINFLDKNIIVNDAKREEAKEKLMYLAHKALEEVNNIGPGTIEKYNTQLIFSLEKAGISNAVQKLDFAKGITTFKHDHMHIVTLSKVEDVDAKSHTVIEAAIMLNGLTPKLKQQYEAIRDSTIGSDVRIEGVNMDWYNKLPGYKKDLVHEVSGVIATGNHVIPTPMLSILPGVRNGYEKVTAVKSPDISEIKIVNSNLHCGTPASSAKVLDRAGRQQIADMNIEQLQSYDKNRKITLNILNSGVLGLDNVNEGYILTQLKNTTNRDKTKEVKFSVSPINDWGKAPGGGRDHSEFKQSLKEIGTDLQKDGRFKNVSEYLRNGDKLGRLAESGTGRIYESNETKALTEVNKLEDKELKRILKAAVKARTLIDTSASLDNDNINMAVTTQIGIVSIGLKDETSLLFGLTTNETKSNLHTRVDSCKSGKDRTGYAETKNTAEAVANYLEVEPNSDSGRKNLLSQVAAGHTQELAGLQGGTPGCHGIKQSFVFNLIKNDKEIEGIINQTTANYNVIKRVDPKQIAEVSEQFEKEFTDHKNKLEPKPQIVPSAPLISNYEKLQANRKAVLDFAATIPERIDGEVMNTGKMLLEAKNSLKNGDFEASLQKLDQLKDAKLGIVWSESSDLGYGTRSLIRDARGVTLDPVALRHDAGEKYAMQILNEVRAGKILMDKLDIPESQKNEAKQKLNFIAEYALEHIGSNHLPELSSKNVIEFNTYIIDSLNKAGVKNSAVELNFAKEMTNFKDEHRHIVTLTSAMSYNEKHTVMEAEIMLNGLSPNQKKQYEMIAKSERGQKFSGDEMAWYNEMPTHRQDMLREVAGDIAIGNKIIPTQLLGSLIGIRNAYEKVTAIQSPGKESSEIISQTLHCGAPATKIKIPGNDLPKKEAKIRQEALINAIVLENVEQLQSFVAPGKRMNLNNLTSETPLNARGEDFIFNQLGLVKSNIVDVGASPINKWRVFGGGRDQISFDETLKVIGQELANPPQGKALADVSNIAEFLQTGKSRMKALQELKEYDGTQLGNILEMAVSSKELLSQKSIFSKSENVNLEIASKMNVIENSLKLEGGQLNKIASEQTKNEYATRVDFCKSGKDRTGLLEMKNTLLAVNHHLGIDSKHSLFNKNMERQVAGGHTQEMAGIQGGTIGCHSIKTNPEFGLNKSDKDIDGIINQKSSSFNSKIKVVEEKKTQKTIDNFELQFLAYQFKHEIVAKPELASLAQQPQYLPETTNVQSSAAKTNKSFSSVLNDATISQKDTQIKTEINESTQEVIELQKNRAILNSSKSVQASNQPNGSAAPKKPGSSLLTNVLGTAGLAVTCFVVGSMIGGPIAGGALAGFVIGAGGVKTCYDLYRRHEAKKAHQRMIAPSEANIQSRKPTIEKIQQQSLPENSIKTQIPTKKNNLAELANPIAEKLKEAPEKRVNHSGKTNNKKTSIQKG